MSTLFVSPEIARTLDWDWLRLWFSIGGVLWVQEMTPELPALYMEKPHSVPTIVRRRDA